MPQGDIASFCAIFIFDEGVNIFPSTTSPPHTPRGLWSLSHWPALLDAKEAEDASIKDEWMDVPGLLLARFTFQLNWDQSKVGFFLSREKKGMTSVESTDSIYHKLMSDLPAILKCPFVGFFHFSWESKAYCWSYDQYRYIVFKTMYLWKLGERSIQNSLCYVHLMGMPSFIYSVRMFIQSWYAPGPWETT